LEGVNVQLDDRGDKNASSGFSEVSFVLARLSTGN